MIARLTHQRRLSKEKELFGNVAPQRHLFKEFGIE